jgi:hypothetical protein
MKRSNIPPAKQHASKIHIITQAIRTLFISGNGIPAFD